MKVITATMIASLLAALGCSEPASFQATGPAADVPQPAPMSEPVGVPGPQANIAADAEPPEDQDEDEGEADSAIEILKVAEPTDGKKGQDYGGGLITEPLRQHFMIQNRIAFMTIDNAMKMFKALNDRAPESHDEFMEKIIKENGVSLPELRSGEEYVYDPKTEELMIGRRQ